MPDTFIRFSDMKDSHPSPIDGANDLLAIAHKDQTSATGYTSMTTTPNALGAHAVEDQTFVNFQTTAKTVEGAINELVQGGGGGGSSWTELIGTLVAGQTSVTIQNSVITTSSTIDYYTDVFGVNPTNIVLTTGQVVLTFEAQSSDLGVKVRVS